MKEDSGLHYCKFCRTHTAGEVELKTTCPLSHYVTTKVEMARLAPVSGTYLCVCGNCGNYSQYKICSEDDHE